MQLENKVAIVTGGARGIGLAISKRYVAEGAKVVIADIDSAAGEAAASSLDSTSAKFVPTDVGERRDAESLVAEVYRTFGSLDVLVNNAGIVHGADFLDIEEVDFDRVLRTNLKGAFLVGQATAKRMVADVKAGKPPGAIINMSSINAVVAIPNQVPYCVSKGGIAQLTNVMALSLAPQGERNRTRLNHDRYPQGRRDRPGGKAKSPRPNAARPRWGSGGDRLDCRVSRLRRLKLYERPDGYADGGRLGLNYVMLVPDEVTE